MSQTPSSTRRQLEEAEERRVEIASASTIPGMVTHQWQSAFFAEAIRDQTPRRKKGQPS